MDTRRSFIRKTGAAAASSMIGLSLSQFLTACKEATEANGQGGPFKTLSVTDASELAAIASCIVPTTDSPGANEAGVIYFMDNVLGDGRADMLQPLREGLSDLHSRVQARSASPSSFASLDKEAQVEILTTIEETDFFADVRLLTLAGMFAHPSYGGNRDGIGWDLIGFDDRHAWQPPFGYYDEQLTSDA